MSNLHPLVECAQPSWKKFLRRVLRDAQRSASSFGERRPFAPCSRHALAALLAGVLLALVSLLPAEAQDESQSALIAPAFRAERHFSTGADYLRGLPDGTRVEVILADGAGFDLELVEGSLQARLDEARLEEEGRTLILPGGYRLAWVPRINALHVEAPNEKFSLIRVTDRGGLVMESDGGKWDSNFDPFSLRFPDGTRVDGFDRLFTWEALLLDGSRYRLEGARGTWERLEDLSSPPLVPQILSFQLAADGDDWRVPFHEDHLVFAWNWYAGGLTIEQLIEDVSVGHRRNDLHFYFNGLDRAQPPAEMGGALVGRRLALTGGARVVFHVPGEKPQQAIIFPGAIEPDYRPKAEVIPNQLEAPRAR